MMVRWCNAAMMELQKGEMEKRIKKGETVRWCNGVMVIWCNSVLLGQEFKNIHFISFSKNLEHTRGYHLTDSNALKTQLKSRT